MYSQKISTAIRKIARIYPHYPHVFPSLFVRMIDSIKMNSYQEEDDAESIEAKMLISAKLLERMVSPVTLSSDALLRQLVETI